MGLFGSKKDAPKTLGSDIFSPEHCQKILSVVKSKDYGAKYSDIKSGLVEIAENPDKEYTAKDLTKYIYSAGCFTKMEPELAPMLNEAIAKFKEFKKQK